MPARARRGRAVSDGNGTGIAQHRGTSGAQERSPHRDPPDRARSGSPSRLGEVTGGCHGGLYRYRRCSAGRRVRQSFDRRLNNMGSLTASLLSAAGALQVYDGVFATIQNNVTNANTPGYAEQDPSLVALPFDPGTGLSGGVGAGPLLSTRSEYLEQSVRDQQSQLASAQQTAGDLGQVQPLF